MGTDWPWLAYFLKFRARPMRRRLLIIFRPPLVRMRARKPILRALEILLSRRG